MEKKEPEIRVSRRSWEIIDYTHNCRFSDWDSLNERRLCLFPSNKEGICKRELCPIRITGGSFGK